MRIEVGVTNDGCASTVTGRTTSITDVRVIRTLQLPGSYIPGSQILFAPTIDEMEQVIPAHVVKRIRNMVEKHLEGIRSLHSVEIQATQIIATFVAANGDKPHVLLTKVFILEQYRVAGLVIWRTPDGHGCDWIEAVGDPTSPADSIEEFFIRHAEARGYKAMYTDLCRLGTGQDYDYNLSPLEGTPIGLFILGMLFKPDVMTYPAHWPIEAWFNGVVENALGPSPHLQAHVAHRIPFLHDRSVALTPGLLGTIIGRHQVISRRPYE